ncbi:thiamine-phosphate synthase [Terrihabitans soli]|uniref:Thiamine-phosphate synthase n=1 Tax=Terrihabitans soli TaxID=708113 RepID=A0A6S6QXG3_9HYPH|nr:thiamine phosphate synthase [Terrihabitans soli]BCJ91711.1 thiamine-phosphate synthase [Terrihabitans soli]
MRPDFDLSLYLVAGRPALPGKDLVASVRAAVEGGVTLVQIRDPKAETQQLIEDTRALKGMLKPYRVPLIVNDRIDVAIAAGADGVHLGQDDARAIEARRELGDDFLIGLSVGNPEEFAHSREDLAFVDYLGVGPIKATGTKSDAGAAIGVEGFAKVRALTALPIVAIGGLSSGDAAPLVRAGAQGLAVVSAICGAADPKAAAYGLLKEINSAR